MTMNIREMREGINVSQAQFSEIVGIPQYRAQPTNPVGRVYGR